MGKCGTTIDAAQETVVLAIDFGEKTIADSPELIEKILKSPKVSKAVEDALMAEAKRLMKKQQGGKAITNEDGTKFLGAVGKKAAGAAEAIAKKEITASKEFGEVKRSLQQLECAFRDSPVGIFLNEKKTGLIIVGSVLALGGVTAMYVSKSGDWPAAQMTKLANKVVRFKVLGNVEIGVKDIEFQPSTRTVKATTFASAKWKAVSTKVSFHAGFKDDRFASTNARGEIVVNAGKGVKLTGKGGVGYSINPDAPAGSNDMTYDIKMGIAYGTNMGGSSLSVNLAAYAVQEAMQRKQGGTLGASYKFTDLRKGSMSVDLNAGLGRVQKMQPIGPPTNEVAGQVNLGLTIKFP